MKPVIPRKSNSKQINDDTDWCLSLYRHLVEIALLKVKKCHNSVRKVKAELWKIVYKSCAEQWHSIFVNKKDPRCHLRPFYHSSDSLQDNGQHLSKQHSLSRVVLSSNYSFCRPSNEWESVVPSTSSSSPPTGTPCAIRLACTLCSRQSSAI